MLRQPKLLSKANIRLGIILLMLIFFPFIADSRTLTILFTQIFIFGILAMSYDILLGFTGIVSFGHAMFFGIGAYTTAIILSDFNQSIPVFIASIVVGMII